ncbi:MAG: pilus assembly protein [Chloroflexi bacterium]|nr:pilus assembly protein [Chloroflexota bacterium]
MPKVRSRSFPRPHEKGQSLVELAISLPVILLILLGTFDFGMALFSYSILRDAAQEGALYASFNPENEAEIENRTRNILPREFEGDVFSSPIDLRDEETVSVVINVKGRACEGVTRGAANSIQVQVIYEYPIIMPFTGDIIGSDTIRLNAAASNVILQPPCQ